MIILKITTKRQYEKSEKFGNYYIYFNGHFKEGRDKKISLNFRNNLIGYLDKEKKLIEVNRSVESDLPLYYSLKQNEILISSYIKNFMTNKLNLKENKNVVAELLNYGYILPPSTIYRDIFKVPLLNKIVINLDNQLNITTERLFENRGMKKNCMGLAKYVEKNIKFDKNKKYTLFFSGGLDSSILCMLMKKQKINFNMFSTGFNFDIVDLIEKEYSLSASKELNKETNYIPFDFKKLILKIPEIIFIIEEPINHIQTLLLYSLMKEQKDKMNPILVNGQGADGIFGTNSQYNFINGQGELDLLKSEFSELNFLKKDYVADKERNKREFLEKLSDYNEIDRDFLIDLEGDVDNTISSWTKCANNNSFSIIYPFFQKRFIQKVRTMSWKFRLKEPKFILRELGRKNNLSERLITRKKGTFGPVSDNWGEYLSYLLPISYGYFSKKKLQKFVSNKKDRYVLWNIINYSIWRKIFIEGKSPNEIKIQLGKLMR